VQPTSQIAVWQDLLHIAAINMLVLFTVFVEVALPLKPLLENRVANEFSTYFLTALDRYATVCGSGFRHESQARH
jgi:hypothetical protein